MHTLDRLAALAIILQFLVIVIGGLFVYNQLVIQQMSLKDIEVRLYTMPIQKEEVLVATPSPTLTVKSGYYAPQPTVYMVRPTK